MHTPQLLTLSPKKTAHYRTDSKQFVWADPSISLRLWSKAGEAALYKTSNALLAPAVQTLS